MIQTLGKATVMITGIRCEFYIVKELQHDALIGDEVLTMLDVNITFPDRCVRLAGKAVKSKGWETEMAKSTDNVGRCDSSQTRTTGER